MPKIWLKYLFQSLYITYVIKRGFTPFHHRYSFWHINNRQLLKTLWEKEKLLITSNFSFFQQCFLLNRIFVSLFLHYFGIKYWLSSASKSVQEFSVVGSIFYMSKDILPLERRLWYKLYVIDSKLCDDLLGITHHRLTAGLYVGWLVVVGLKATLTAKVISWWSVMHMCFLAFSHQY